MTLKWKRANKTETTNEGNRAIWLVYRTDTDADGFWLVKRTFGWKNFMPENFLEINRYFALTSYCNTIVQSNNAFSMLGFSLAGKRRVHVLIFSSIGSWNRWRTLTEPFFKVIRKSLYCIFVVVVDRHLPRFEALAYVLPHFDALTDVVILVSSAFIFQRFAERGDEWSLRTFASMPSTAIFCEHEQV